MEFLNSRMHSSGPETYRIPSVQDNSPKKLVANTIDKDITHQPLSNTFTVGGKRHPVPKVPAVKIEKAEYLKTDPFQNDIGQLKQGHTNTQVSNRNVGLLSEERNQSSDTLN